MDKPKISVIIPVYNFEKYLESCLDSVINQSFKNIEIICVNDCSTDNSLSILKRYADKDDRIIIVDKKENQGLLSARKSGVSIADGDYIVFVDSDDYIDYELCEFAANICADGYDIVQYNVKIENNSSNDKDADWLSKRLHCENRILKNDDIILQAYNVSSYATSIVGKIFKTDLCKKVYSTIPDEYCYVGEDIYTYFVISCLAKKYRSVDSKEFYIYRYGLGVENSDKMQLAKFEQYCKMSKWVMYGNEFLQKISGNKIQYDALKNMQCRMFEDCCKIYKDRIFDEDKDNAAKLIVKYWEKNEVTDKVMKNKLGTTMEQFIYQTTVPVYIKRSKKYNGDSLPKVSVIVPIYNVEKYISECLESLINQTLKDIEIICVNDGSPDNSLEIIEKYAQADDRITVISQKNGGLSAARNAGLSYAKGKYVYFLDSDDFIKPNALEVLFEISEKENLDILYFGVDNYFENDNLNGTDTNLESYYERNQFFKTAVKGDVLFEKFVAENMFICCVPFQFIKKDFIDISAVKFKVKMLHEDELFSPQIILKAERTMVIEDKLYMRRIRENSITTVNYTHKNFIGYFWAYVSHTSKIMTDDKYSEKAKVSLGIYSKKLYNTARRIYRQLSKEEKYLVDVNLPLECKILFQPIREQEILLESIPYKVGMAVTFIPRKLNAVLKALKNRGIKGTWQLIRKYYFK